MAFFDDLGKKLSQAGQATVQKTKELADIAKINSYINDEEKKINNFYLEIGKLYVSLNQEGYASEYAEMIQGIRDAEIKIEEYNTELIQIKGVRKCPNCGAEVKNEAAFCSGCGEKMPIVEKPSDDENIVEGEGTEVENPVETNQEQTKSFCPNCGVEVKNDAAFCAECGTKIK